MIKKTFILTLCAIAGMVLLPNNAFASTLTDVSVSSTNSSAAATTTLTFTYTIAQTATASPYMIFRGNFGLDDDVDFDLSAVTTTSITVTDDGVEMTLDELAVIPANAWLYIRVTEAAAPGSVIVVIIEDVVNPDTPDNYTLQNFGTADNGGVLVETPAAEIDLIVTPPGSGTVEDPYQISECLTIAASGYYILTQNLSTTEDCITIEAHGVTVDGDGYTIQGDGSLLTEGIVLEGYNTTTIKNITIDNFYDGIMFWNNASSTISGVTITSSTDDGMDMHGVRLLTISNTTIVSSTDDGMEFYPYDNTASSTFVQSLGVTITSSTIEDVGDRGIDAEGITYLVLDQVTIEGVGDIGIAVAQFDDTYAEEIIRSTDFFLTSSTIQYIGFDAIALWGVDDVFIIGNTIAHAQEDDGIDISPYDDEYVGTTVSSTDITIQNNTIEFIDNDAIVIEGGSDIFIIDNVINSSTSSNGIDIYYYNDLGTGVTTTVRRLTISDNTISNTDAEAIELVYVSDVTIEDNIIQNIDDNGISMSDADTVTVEGNTIQNTDGTGLFMQVIDTATIESNSFVAISGEGISAYSIIDVDIVDNTFQGIDSDAVWIAESLRVAISENTFTGVSQDAIDFTIDDDGQQNRDITIHDNVLRRVLDNGIELDEVYGATITENDMQISGDGIAVDDSADIIFTDNEIAPRVEDAYVIPTVEDTFVLVNSEEAVDEESDDDDSFTYELPFTFPFFGKDIVEIEINTNGTVELLEVGESCLICDSYSAFEEELIADVFFVSYDDLNMETGEDDRVAVFEPNESTVVIEWFGSTYDDEDSDTYPIHMQLVLHDDGTTAWNFDQMDFDSFGYSMFSGAYNVDTDDLYVAGFEIDEPSSYAADFSGNSDFGDTEAITFGAPIGLDLDTVADSQFSGNRIQTTQWVYGVALDNIDFYDSDTGSGNAYYFVTGEGAWTVFDITDSTGNGYANKGDDRPFSSTTLGIALWEGEGLDPFPYTETDYVSGRSGGGAAYIPPKPPKVQGIVEKVKEAGSDDVYTSGAFTINNGAAETNNRTVTLTFTDIENTAQVAVSESPTFAGASYQPFADTLSYTLSIGNGTKTVYAKLRSSEGATLVLKDTILLTGTVETPTPGTTETPINPDQALQCTSNAYLINAVGPNRTNNPQDVRLLEEFLNTYEGANLPVNGIYESADIAAVIAWQEKHAADVLAPWGITNGTGYVFTSSLAKIKQIHEANCATATQPTLPPTTPTTPNNTSTACLETTQTLTLGMNNTLVATAQRLLKKLGYFPADIDTTGYFGSITRTATVDFQAANQIDQLGIIGPQTRARLNALGCN